MTSHNVRTLVRVRKCANVLAHNLGRARDRTCDLANDPIDDLDMPLTCAFPPDLLALVEDLYLALGGVGASDITDVPVGDVARARDLARDVARNLAGARARALKDAFARDLARARVLASDYADVKAFARDVARANLRDHDLEYAENVGYVVNSARELTRALDLAVPLVLNAQGSRSAISPRKRQPGWATRHLVHRAVWCLPRTHQARYREEFDAELAEITESGRRWRQWGYGLRLIGQALRLRHALRTPAPGRSGRDDPAGQTGRLGSG